MVTVHQPLSLPDLTLHDSPSLDYLIEPVADADAYTALLTAPERRPYFSIITWCILGLMFSTENKL